MQEDGRATAALVLAAFLFGSTFLVVQDATDQASVLAFLAVRFLFAAALLWPLARRRPPGQHEIRHGLAAGSCLLAGFVLQTVGLQLHDELDVGLHHLSARGVRPGDHSLLGRKWPARSVLVGVVLSVAGLLPPLGRHDGFGLGELLTLGCALAFAPAHRGARPDHPSQ